VSSFERAVSNFEIFFQSELGTSGTKPRMLLFPGTLSRRKPKMKFVAVIHHIAAEVRGSFSELSKSIDARVPGK
jgi:hypothetical protein